jgi:AraC-like DNA-binding protein
MDASEIIDTLLRGLAMGAFGATLAVLVRGHQSVRMRILACACFAGIIAHVAAGLTVITRLDWTVREPVWLASNVVPGLLWAFLLGVFDDRRDRFWPRLIPFALLVISIPAARAALPSMTGYWVVYYIATNGMMLHILWTLFRGLKGDLVEARRQLRAPVIALAAAYVALNALANMLGGPLSTGTVTWQLIQAAALVILGLGSVLGFAQPGPAVWTAAAADGRDADRAGRADAPPASAADGAGGEPAPADGLDRVALARLKRALEEGEVWRREGLGIAALARELDMPEYRLRRLINERLGYRNFADFVNSHRIAAAQAVLADPQRARHPITQLAFDVGFASVGPFNRAFRQETGLSPSDYRARALADQVLPAAD